MQLKRSLTTKLQRFASSSNVKSAGSKRPTISGPVNLIYSTYTGEVSPIGSAISSVGSDSDSSSGRLSSTSALSSPNPSILEEAVNASETTESYEDLFVNKRHSHAVSMMSDYKRATDDNSDVVSYIESVLDLGLEKHSAEEYLSLIDKH
jgi:hypothetical protein